MKYNIHEGLRPTFLSVGHGKAVVLELPDGHTVLYGAGRTAGQPLAAHRLGLSVDAGVPHIDAVVLSHADSDHYNALPELLERFSVGTVYVSPVMFDATNASLRYLSDAIDRAKAESRNSCGDQISACPVRASNSPSAAARPAVDPLTPTASCFCVEYGGRRYSCPRSSVAGAGRRAGRASAALRPVVSAAPRQQDEPAGEARRLEHARLGGIQAPTIVTTPAASRRFTPGTAACCTRPTRGP